VDEVKPVADVPTVEHREPCDSRGSCTVLGAPGGEIPPGDSSFATDALGARSARCPEYPESRHEAPAQYLTRCTKTRLTHRSDRASFYCR